MIFGHGAKIAFSILINNQNYDFYAGVKNIKKRPELGTNAVSMGIKIYMANPPDGIHLLATFVNQLINQNEISKIQ